MNLGAGTSLALVACLTSMVACQSPNAQGSSQPASTIGAPSHERPKQNVRKLRSTLAGKEMKEVVRILGQPSQVFTLEERETWDYKNAAYDPVTGQTVRSLQILFVNRLVESVNFSY